MNAAREIAILQLYSRSIHQMCWPQSRKNHWRPLKDLAFFFSEPQKFIFTKLNQRLANFLAKVLSPLGNLCNSNEKLMTSLFQVPAGSGHHPYVQGPYLQPGPTIPKSPYSVPVVPSPAQFHESGICEVILVIFVFLLWLYSFYRLYLVWQKTLNFSESSIQGPQGWDLLVNWVMERIQVSVKKLKSRPLRGLLISCKRVKCQLELFWLLLFSRIFWNPLRFLTSKITSPLSFSVHKD